MSTLPVSPARVNLTPWRALSAVQRVAELDRIRREYPIRPGDCPELDARLERDYPLSDEDPADDPRWDDARERPGDDDTIDLPELPLSDPDDDPDTTTPDESWPGRGTVEEAEFGPKLSAVTRAATASDWAEYSAWSSALDFPETTNPDWLRCPVVRDWDREYEDAQPPMFGYE